MAYLSYCCAKLVLYLWCSCRLSQTNPTHGLAKDFTYYAEWILSLVFLQLFFKWKSKTLKSSGCSMYITISHVHYICYAMLEVEQNKKSRKWPRLVFWLPPTKWRSWIFVRACRYPDARTHAHAHCVLICHCPHLVSPCLRPVRVSIVYSLLYVVKVEVR